MHHSKSILLILSFLFVACFIHAQICFDSYNTEECPYRIIGEFAVSAQLNPLYERNSNFDFAVNLGIQKRIKGDFSMGVHLFSNLIVGGRNSEFQTGIRPRLAYKLSQELETSFSPGIILSSSLNDLNKLKGLSLESNISWRNKVGVAFRVDKYYSTINGNDTVVNLGLQTHANTAFYSMGGVVLGSAVIFLLLQGLIGG